MKKIAAFFAVILSATLSAQIDLGIPSTTGKGGTATAMVNNFEAIGINPANLGWNDNYRFSITLANGGVNMQSQALDLATLKGALLSPRDSFTLAQKQELSNKFATPEGFNMTVNINWLATSFYIPKVGGFAINVRDRAYAHVGLNQNASDFIFLGKNASFFQDTTNFHKNLSTIFDGCDLSVLYYREANISYGRRIIALGDADADGDSKIQLFAGIGLKMMWGLANVDGRVGDGLITGHSSISSSFDINYGNIRNFTSQKTSNLFNSVGSGTAIDFGTSLVINKKFRFGFSLTDIGSINWKDNVLTAHDTTLFHPDSTNTGLPNWDLSHNSGFLFGNDGFVNYGPGSDYKSTLPSKIRLGAGMKIGEHVNVGADVVIPYTKNRYNLSTPYIAVGGEVKVAAMLKINAGVSGNGDLGWNLPMGVTIGPIGFMEIGLATGDLLTYLSKSKDPNMSMAIGLIRVNLDPSIRDAANTNGPPTPAL